MCLLAVAAAAAAFAHEAVELTENAWKCPVKRKILSMHNYQGTNRPSSV